MNSEQQFSNHPEAVSGSQHNSGVGGAEEGLSNSNKHQDLIPSLYLNVEFWQLYTKYHQEGNDVFKSGFILKSKEVYHEFVIEPSSLYYDEE